MKEISSKTRRHNDDGEPILNYEKKKVPMKNPLTLTGLRGKFKNINNYYD